MLVMTAEETAGLLDMSAVMDALEPLYGDLARSLAGNGPRVDLMSPGGMEKSVHDLKSMSGAAPRYSLAAVRITSDILLRQEKGGQVTRKKVPSAGDGCWVGLLLLFDTQSGRPLAMVPDGYVQRIRVAAANGIAARYLAREDARVVGLIGSGWQAGAQILAMRAARDIQCVRVWSPNPNSRERFADTMSKMAGVPVIPVGSKQEAVRDADIVCTAVSANEVLTGDMVQPGQFLTNVRMTEFSPDTYEVADTVVWNLPEGDRWQKWLGAVESPKHFTPNLPRRHWDTDQCGILLQDLVTGKVPRRKAPGDVTVFVNNFGGGIQFAAVGKVLLENAKERGVGTQLPDELILQKVTT